MNIEQLNSSSAHSWIPRAAHGVIPPSAASLASAQTSKPELDHIAHPCHRRRDYQPSNLTIADEIASAEPEGASSPLWYELDRSSTILAQIKPPGGNCRDGLLL
jgi:hypothetical protein